MDTFRESDTGFPIRYRFDGKSLNPRTLKAKPKVQPDVLDELLYADDMDKNACSEAKMKRAVDQVSQSCDNYDLTINTKKTEVVSISSWKMNNEPAITVNGQNLKTTGMQIMHTVLKLAQLRWIGHILRMYDERLPKHVFYGAL